MGSVIRFISGVLLAIALLFLAGAGVTRYLIGRLSVPPERPVFENEQPQPVADSAPASEAPEAPPAPTDPPPSPEASPSPSPTPEETSYNARVIQPIGLILRAEPSQDSAQVGGLEYNTEVRVVEESTDGGWIRVEGNGMEGWVRAGNTEDL
jgi:hypothetical protein